VRRRRRRRPVRWGPAMTAAVAALAPLLWLAVPAANPDYHARRYAPQAAPQRAAARWGVNVHWERCDLGQPCPPIDLGASGGPRPGEVAQLGRAFGRARTGVRWFLVEQERGVYNFSAYERMLADLEQVGVGAYWILAHGNPLYGSKEAAPISEAQRKGFARFAVAMMAHFRGRGVVWECWK
jgi:hypothetical protein